MRFTSSMTPRPQRQLKQYFLLWKSCCGFTRVASIVTDEHGQGMFAGRDINLGDPHLEEEEEATAVQPAPAEDKPTGPTRRASVAGMSPRKGSTTRMSVMQFAEQSEKIKDLFSGQFGSSSDRWVQPANAVFYRKFSFNGWKGLARRGGASKKQLKQRMMDTDAKRVLLTFQLWVFRHNSLKANWEKAEVYMESKEYALVSRVFSWWARGAWRKRREKVFELRLEHAVWELNDNKLTWEAEVMRLEQELAEITGYCSTDPAVFKKKMRRPKPPPPLPRDGYVGWDAFVEKEFADRLQTAAGEEESEAAEEPGSDVSED